MHRIFIKFWFILSIGCVVSSCSTTPKNNHFTDGFNIQKGLNLACWFSQESESLRNGQISRKDYINYSDLKLIKNLGFDHIRLPIHEARFFDTTNFNVEANMHLLQNTLDSCYSIGLRVVLDLHLTRYHQFIENHPFWQDTVGYKKLIDTWERLHAHVHNYPTNFLAYELLAEPVPTHPEQWNRVIAKTFPAIRELEPERKIIIGPGHWNNIEALPGLKLPKNDTNIIITIHFYEPYLLTHYQAGWAAHAKYNGPVNYPGVIIDSVSLLNEPDYIKQFVETNINYMDCDSMQNMFARAVEYAERYNMNLYCGEFGCLKKVPRSIRLQWYRDAVAIMNKYEVPYTHWDYKCRNEFGIRTEEGELDKELIEILLGKTF